MRQRAALLASALLLCAPAGTGAATEAARELANTLPRNFGYVIGERFTQHIRFAAPASYQLDAASLPRLGRANRWLELQAIDSSRRTVNGEHIHDLGLTYQVMTSDDVISLAPLPRLALQLTRAGQRITLHTGEQFISVSPLTETETWNHGGLQALRPERGTPLANTLATQQRMGGYLIALLALAAFWLYRVYGLPVLARSRSPFYRAWRAVRKLRVGDEVALAGALRAVHHAFDATHGKTVFQPDLEAFLATHTRYAPLREPIQWFFELSRQRFYAGVSCSAAQLAELRQLARRLSYLERGLA